MAGGAGLRGHARRQAAQQLSISTRFVRRTGDPATCSRAGLIRSTPGSTALLNDGNSIYHSLQAKLEHRWKNGLLIQTAYTWSKLIDDIDGPSRANGAPYQDVYNLRADRGVGGYDTPHRFVASYVYQVPLGRHGKYLNTSPWSRT